MLAIAPPRLTPSEWTGVRRALDTVADCGCANPAPAGSVRDRVARAFYRLSGHEPVAIEITPQQRAIRDFLCESGRAGRLAEDHASALDRYGFTRAQIEAMALIAA